MKRLLKYFASLGMFAMVALTPIQPGSPLPTLAPGPTPTSPEGWYIDSFADQITIQQDGTVKVVENISVDFVDLSKHGIYRDLPITYQREDGGKLYTTLDVESIQRDGVKEPFERQSNGNNIRLKIGDADKTITGKHTYTIVYNAKGVLSSFDNYDEFYWNISGNEWPVPILSASAHITLPKNEFTQGFCYQGVLGSTEQCTLLVEQTTAQTQTTRYLDTGEGMTVALGFPKGTVPIVQVSQTQSLLERYRPWLFLPLPIILTALFLAYKWYTNGRDRWMRQRYADDSKAKHETRPIFAHETLVVNYDPPEKLRPAELGTLMDQKADTDDVTATIVDLAGRGYLTIAEEEKKGMFGSTDYVLTKTKKATSDLLTYEMLLMEKLFATADGVKLSDLKNKFYKDLKLIKESIYTSVTDKGLFDGNPEKARSRYAVIGSVLLFGLFFVGAFAAVSWLLPFVIGCGVSGLLFLFVSRHMPRRSAKGYELYRQAKGYELFLSKAEKHRQQFFERKNMFNEILPYAIVLGLTEKYMNAFKELGIEPPSPTWYTGTHAFHAASFSNDLNSFSSSLSSTMASAPRGSGSGGGGFSGGGGGGGGGGSW